MPRLFVALLPDGSTRGRLQGLQRRLVPRTSSARLIAPESLHMTLAFIGARDRLATSKLIEALSGLTLPPITAQSTGWLWLPTPDRPRVLALGLEADSVLSTLTQQVWAVLDAVGWARPQWPFLPHVSLARLSAGAGPFPLTTVPATTLRWACMALLASDLSPSGARYQPLWSVSSGQT